MDPHGEVVVLQDTIATGATIGRVSGLIRFPFLIYHIAFLFSGAAGEYVTVPIYISNDDEDITAAVDAGTNIIAPDAQSRNFLLVPGAYELDYSYPVYESGKHIRAVLTASTLAATRAWAIMFHVKEL